MTTLSERIEKLMLEKGKCAAEMCREVNISPKTMYNIRQTNAISSSTLFKLAAYFGVTADYIKNGDETKKAEPATADPADNARVRDVSNYGVEGIDTELLGSNEELIERLNKQISELKYMVESYKEVVEAQRKLIESLREK